MAVSYWYARPVPAEDESAVAAFGDVMYSNWVGNHEDGGNVAYLDGHVVWRDVEQWQQENLPVEPLLQKEKRRQRSK